MKATNSITKYEKYSLRAYYRNVSQMTPTDAIDPND